MVSQIVFPCIRAGASLKHGGAVSQFAGLSRFPLHSCRGLIEAIRHFFFGQ